MKKGKKLILSIALGSMLFCGGLAIHNNISSKPTQPTSYAHKLDINIDNHNKNALFANSSSIVKLENKTLEAALKKVLGVETLRQNSIVTHNDYREYETTIGSGVYTANKTGLDLSNTGVTDITELCLFEFPSTLTAINLAGNGIQNEHLDKIIEFTTYSAYQENIDYNGKTLTSQSNFDLIISKINLCFNDISLTTLPYEITSNNYSKLIFGIQKMNNLHETGLVTKEELINCYYYFREADYSFVHPGFVRNGIPVSFDNEVITQITASEIYGDYQITINGGSTGIFANWQESHEFTVFLAKVKDGYFAEKRSPFKLTDSDLIFDGITPTWKIEGTPIINTLGTQTLNLKITDNDITRLIYIDYEVKDTIAPELKLTGSNHITIRDTSIPFDPVKKGLVMGFDGFGTENITGNIQCNADEVLEIKDYKYVTKTYIITCTLKDASGNEATPLKLTVTVQEGMLDKIVIKNQTDEKNLVTDADIVLEVKPDEGIPTQKYHGYKYEWFVNGVAYGELTLGDSVSGRSIKIFNFDNVGTYEITVILTAKDESNNTITVQSDTFILEVSQSNKNNQIVIIAAAIAIGAILIVISIVTIVKYRKAHKKSHQKTSAYHKKNEKTQQNKGNEIQVIKNYNPNNAGNVNSKPDNSNKEK